VDRLGGRVINVSSSAGNYGNLGPALRASITADNLTVDGLTQLMDKFVSDVKAGVHEKEGADMYLFFARKTTDNTESCRPYFYFEHCVVIDLQVEM
jgi:hypothetical protein